MTDCAQCNKQHFHITVIESVLRQVASCCLIVRNDAVSASDFLMIVLHIMPIDCIPQ